MAIGIKDIEAIKLGSKYNIANAGSINILDDSHGTDGIFFIDAFVENTFNQLLFSLNSCCSHIIFSRLWEEVVL